jgi:FKBP-type peptidyl-prolyl cis-trans isomerase SlyD
MKITSQCVASLTWTLSDTLGEELDVLQEPVEFLVGGDDLFKVVEDALQGLSAGSTINLQIEPEQGFGEYNEQLVFLEPRAVFPEKLEEGMIFEGGALPSGCSLQAVPGKLYTATDIYPEHVVLDGNHPLSGIALRLRLTVRSVREATAEEVGAGTAGTGFFRIAPTPEPDLGEHTLH